VEQEIQQATAAYQLIVEFFINYSFQILGALIILLIGVLIARKIGHLILRLCERKNLDITLSRFIASTAKIIVIVMVAVVVLGKLGISVTPFLAVIGALSLGAGLALQGLLSNYGAGFNIIITRPFVVGDTIKIQGVTGLVKEVHLAFTILTNEDEVEITIPNKHIVGEILHNSHEDTLAEQTIGVAYSSDPTVAINVIEQALKRVEQISEKRAPLVGIASFGDSAINIGVRFWVPTQTYYQTSYKANSIIFAALKEANIEIPFPQSEVRLLPETHSDK
jgi:small conductance mechanosensitive channel